MSFRHLKFNGMKTSESEIPVCTTDIQSTIKKLEIDFHTAEILLLDISAFTILYTFYLNGRPG